MVVVLLVFIIVSSFLTFIGGFKVGAIAVEFVAKTLAADVLNWITEEFLPLLTLVAELEKEEDPDLSLDLLLTCL